MKSRNQKSAKAGGSKKKVPSDVSPSTSLPPLVEGPLRCFLRVTVSRVLWTVHKPPSATFIRLRWWGESSNGTHFLPRDGSQLSQKTIKTTARFPIRCGPKQFTSYLTDMGSLVMEVLTKPDHLPIARTQVTGISRLSLSHPISGFYTLVSPTSEKLGELQVSLSLEPLTEAYDSSSSCPATDISAEGPQVTTLTVPLQPRSPSVGSSGANAPRGKDHLYFQNEQNDQGKHESLENQLPRTNMFQNSQTAGNPSSQDSAQNNNDILSVILERGNKLRNAMVVSALKCDTDPASALKDTPLPLPKDNILPTTRPSPSPSGMFLQNILHADSALKHSEDVFGVKDSGLDCPAGIDNIAVDLLLGSRNTSPVPLMDGDGSPPESLSDHSSMSWDQSLLENVFYKTPISNETPTKPEAGDPEKTSSSQKQLKQCEPNIRGRPSIESRWSEDAGPPSGQKSLLSLIRLAKVTIESLTVPSEGTKNTPRKVSSKGKPPQPLNSKKCTYFIEYTFPKASASSRHDRSKSGEGDVTRAVASKVSGGVVMFHQHAVFPVHCNTSTVKLWWETDLIFKIYSRRSDQKKPVLIGKAVHPLCCLLQSKQLCQSVTLPVQRVAPNSEMQEVGPIKVTLELATNAKEFSSEKSKRKLAWKDTSPSQTAPSPQRESNSRSKHADKSRDDFQDGSIEESRLNPWSPQKPSTESLSYPGLHTPHKSHQWVEEDPEVLLHTLLMVPDGKTFNCGLGQAPNVYLNCKLFWCDETARSVISWGRTNPSFNFVQVTPVALTSKLLERMKNNVMVIEVWQKTGSSGQDRLLGLVKLPLHQFYMSFRDPKIGHLLLQAQYPVLGVDCYMPVVDVFSGSCKGHLRVVLALGRSEQIVAFQRTRDEEFNSLSHLVRPVHLLDHQPQSQTKVIASHKESMREHVFVIRVEKVTGLTPLQSTVWGEADCYVQYSFPCQEGDAATKGDQNLIESSLNLRGFRTTTTLCIPDPVFSHTETHVLLAPDGVPAQRLLLSSLSSQGLSGGGGVQFEVWCRYYYPNVRDQLVAKGLLPLSKLCAMITMQRQHPDEAQMFSLPLIPRADGHTSYEPQPSGLLDVCIRYKHRPVRPEGQAVRGAAARVVTLVVQVHRASGLQAAARVLSEQDERFSYFAGVGVNSYVTVELSFLSESERRCTRVAARTFCPEFDHHMEVSCDLLVQRSSGETCSLAEQLEEATAVFTVWNKDSRKGLTVLDHRPKDVMLGTVKIPLSDLISKRTGISGWFGLYIPQETRSSHNQHILVGGLEIAVFFAHHSDRERVTQAAQGVGWEIHQNEIQEEEEDWCGSTGKLSLTFSMPRAWIPVHCLLLSGHTELQRSTYIYFRYKFYDHEAFCSQMKHPSIEEEGQATVTFQGNRTVEVRSTQPLMWYLREERLEVQVWVAFKKDKTQRPRDTDRLVGSAFVDLSSLTKTSKQKLTLSGVYPLFRRSAADLQGAALRVHVTLTVGFDRVEVPPGAGADTQVNSDSQEELLPEEVEVAKLTPSPCTPKTSSKSKHKKKTTKTTPDITSEQRTGTSLDESFPVTVTVDRAMHLNLKGCPLTERSGGMPCCCVSFLTADSDEPASTAVIADTDCPVWEHHHECRLSKQLLVDPQQSLVFKVWHKGETERVLGFASVDLSPLLCGFQSVCGWYNITDFSGQCHGQLKVSITPLRGLQDLRGLRKTVNEEAPTNSSALFQAFPLTYHTTATYSSFPAHISRYPEQKISSPDHTERLFSERSSESDRHFEHMDKVRLYHQSLQEQTANTSVCSTSAADINPSSSFLFSALRKKLSELDNIQRYFSRKLSTPTFPPLIEQDVGNKQVEERDTETDSCQLLLRSNQLVGEVNSIISGLREESLEMIPSNPQSISTASPVRENNLQTIPETLSSPRRDSDSSQDDVLRLLTPLPDLPKDNSDSESEEEKYEAAVAEDENEEASDKDEERTVLREEEEVDGNDEEEDDADYVEVVLKPQPLNEMTSLTDKTSPWTSIMSDPDLVSLQSLEASDEANLSQDAEENWQMIYLQTHGCGGEQECASGEGRELSDESFKGSAGDVSRTNRDDEKMPQNLQEREEPSSSDEESCPSPITQHTTDTHDASGSEDKQGSPLTPLLEVPNFFLPSHQLEASMRTIRLAPSFSLSSTGTARSSSGPSRPHLQGPRHPPNMSPSSMKKETERIAKIFAAHLDKNH